MLVCADHNSIDVPWNARPATRGSSRTVQIAADDFDSVLIHPMRRAGAVIGINDSAHGKFVVGELVMNLQSRRLLSHHDSAGIADAIEHKEIFLRRIAVDVIEWTAFAESAVLLIKRQTIARVAI